MAAVLVAGPGRLGAIVVPLTLLVLGLLPRSPAAAGEPALLIPRVAGPPTLERLVGPPTRESLVVPSRPDSAVVSPVVDGDATLSPLYGVPFSPTPESAAGSSFLDHMGVVSVPDRATASFGRDRLLVSPAIDSVTVPPAGVVREFRQREPGDGTPCSLETEATVSYDDENLYVRFIAKDDPAKVRGHLAKREDILGDDRVVLYLDTFHDGHRAYLFACNPVGVQLDGTLTEGQDEDDTFDTLWYSEGRLTPDGYVVVMTIPFRSLRFDNTSAQTWGIALGRIIPRRNEESYWPYITKRVHGFISQFAPARGLEGISPGQSIQLIPYGISTRARFLDMESTRPGFRDQDEVRGGLDAKFVLHDQFAFDAAVNPDFSQVESDEPQVTINQRYEVAFPERRPFFLENASFFQAPTELFFSRRIADPQYGMRMTGKAGRWALGALAMDDRAPGLKVPIGDPLRGERAMDAVVGIQRDIGKQSSVGLLATSRDFGQGFNRVVSMHTQLQLDPTLALTAQAMRSFNQPIGKPRVDAPGYYAELIRDGRHFDYDAYVSHLSPDFRAPLGYVKRVDITKFKQQAQYLWRPKRSGVTKFGPTLTTVHTTDHAGQLQDWSAEGDFELAFTGQTKLHVIRTEAFERFEGLGFRKYANTLEFGTEWLKWLAVDASASVGTEINYDPARGLAPFLADAQEADVTLTLRPSPQLRVDQTFIYSRLMVRSGSSMRLDTTSAHIFENPLVRWKLNYQISRALSMRAIVDYDAVWPNVSFVKLEREQQLTGDVLATYLVNPGTALYVGYTNRQENLALDAVTPSVFRRTDSPDLVTGRQFFLKLSYLIRR